MRSGVLAKSKADLKRLRFELETAHGGHLHWPRIDSDTIPKCAVIASPCLCERVIGTWTIYVIATVQHLAQV